MRTCWEAARKESAAAYRAWGAATEGRGDAYAVYRAAEDREAAAALAFLLVSRGARRAAA